MTNEELKNLFPPQMRVINTTKENGEALLRGETVMDSEGNETTMGFNDVVAVPDDTDEKIEALEKQVNACSPKLYRHEVRVSYYTDEAHNGTLNLAFLSSRSTAYTAISEFYKLVSSLTGAARITLNDVSYGGVMAIREAYAGVLFTDGVVGFTGIEAENRYFEYFSFNTFESDNVMEL